MNLNSIFMAAAQSTESLFYATNTMAIPKALLTSNSQTKTPRTPRWLWTIPFSEEDKLKCCQRGPTNRVSAAPTDRPEEVSEEEEGGTVDVGDSVPCADHGTSL